MDIISRGQAAKEGRHHYFTGKPCKRGGVAPRRVNNYQCTCHLCMKKSSEKASLWQKNNKGKARSRKKIWAERNKSHVIASRKEKYERNKEYIKEKSRVYRRENPEKVKLCKQKWYLDNKHYAIDASKVRHGIRRSRKVSWFGELDELVIKEAYDLCKRREEATGMKWEIDHMIPLRANNACGLHCAQNIQVIPLIKNRAKMNQMIYIEPLSWLKE